MKILFAPDKFKGTLTAPDVTRILAGEFRKRLPDAELVSIPLADGGEGTVDALTAAAGGTFLSVTVRGPLGSPVRAVCGRKGSRFFMEMSSASGMALLKKTELDPMKASTYGTGELIRYALDSGAEEIILGIGGSATCDGGAGMAEALGCRFYDEKGELLTGLCGGNLCRIASVDLSGLSPRLKQCRIRTASDVRNPLLGPEGSARVFAPQKGATEAMIPLLEQGLANLADRLHVPPDTPGDGAAGGLGYGLRVFCGAHPESGAQLIMSASGFLKQLEGSDLVITGEGCTDSQTEAGKVCSEIALACRRANVPCVLLSGSVRASRQELMRTFDSVFISGIGRKTAEECLAHAEEDMQSTAATLAIFASLFRRKS